MSVPARPGSLAAGRSASVIDLVNLEAEERESLKQTVTYNPTTKGTSYKQMRGRWRWREIETER